MADPFLGEIKLVPYAFEPRGWKFCNGKLLLINEYTALYSLLLSHYGGDGTTNFRLPDLRGRVPVGSISMGTGPGLSQYPLGSKMGVETVNLTANQLANHTHNNSLTVSSSSVTVSVDIPGYSPSR